MRTSNFLREAIVTWRDARAKFSGYFRVDLHVIDNHLHTIQLSLTFRDSRPANEPSVLRIGHSQTRLGLTCARLGSFSEIKSILGLGSSRLRS